MSDVVDVSDKIKVVFVDFEECIDNTSSNFLVNQMNSLHIVIEKYKFFEVDQLMIRDVSEQLNITLTTFYTEEDGAENVTHDRKYESLLVKKMIKFKIACKDLSSETE